LELLKNVFNTFVFEILGFKADSKIDNKDNISGDLIEMLLKMRHQAKLDKDWATADNIRNQLTDLGITIKDTKDGADWEIV